MSHGFHRLTMYGITVMHDEKVRTLKLSPSSGSDQEAENKPTIDNPESVWFFFQRLVVLLYKIITKPQWQRKGF